MCSSKPAVPTKPQLSQAVGVPPNNNCIKGTVPLAISLPACHILIGFMPFISSDADAAEKLYLEAESLMDLANEKQEKGDVSMALLHCNKAFGECPSLFAVADTLIH